MLQARDQIAATGKKRLTLRARLLMGSRMRKADPEITQERNEAWIGDAVLAMYARKWILENDKKMDGEKFVRFTSNDFLRRFGNPTSEEAAIGRIYEQDGLEAAFAHMEERYLKRFIDLEKQRVKQRLK